MSHFRRPLFALATVMPILLGACASHVHRVQQHEKADTVLQRACVSPFVVPTDFQIMITMSSYGGTAPIAESVKLAAFARSKATIEVYKEHYSDAVTQELHRRNIDVVPCDGAGARQPQARLGAQLQLVTVDHPAVGLYMTKLHVLTVLNKLPQRSLAWEASIESGDRIRLNNGADSSYVKALAGSIGDELQRAGWAGPKITPAAPAASGSQK